MDVNPVIARIRGFHSNRTLFAALSRNKLTQSANIKVIDVDKIGSAASPLKLAKTVAFISSSSSPRAGDVVVVRALTDSATYNMLELPTGRLAKINPGDLLIGVLGRRRALKGFVGDVPATGNAGDELHLLNMGGVIGCCTGHHSSLGDAIKLEVLGLACGEEGNIRNIVDAAIPPKASLGYSAPLVLIAGTSMNSGKTYAATELIKQATRAGLKVSCGQVIRCRLFTRHVEYERPWCNCDCEFPRLRSAFNGRCRRSRSDREGDHWSSK